MKARLTRFPLYAYVGVVGLGFLQGVRGVTSRKRLEPVNDIVLDVGVLTF